jgi:hypothetical protein
MPVCMTCTIALTVERVDRNNGALQGKHFQQLRHGGDLIGLGIGGDLPQHHLLLAAPGADHVQRRLVAGPIERTAQHLAVDGDNALDGIGKPPHEALENRAELLGVKQAEQAAEGVVAGQAALQLEEAAQERLLRRREPRHVGRTLAAAQHGAQRDEQQFPLEPAPSRMGRDDTLRYRTPPPPPDPWD